MSGRKEDTFASRRLRRAINLGATGAAVVVVLSLGITAVAALVTQNLGTTFIQLDKTPFDDVTIPANSGALVTPQTMQTIAPGAAAAGDTSPGLEATTALPWINNVLTAGNTSHRFQVREDQANSFQAGDKFLVEVSEDATVVASLYMKQDIVDDLNVEGVTVEVDIGATAGAMSTAIKKHRSATLTVVDGYDQKNSTTLVAAGTLFLVQTSDDDWYQQDTPYYTSFQFSDVTIPVGSSITSVTIFVEHYEDGGYQGPLLWKVGTGWPGAPTEWGNTTPTILSPKNQEATISWDVTTLVNTPIRVNDMELVVQNDSVNGKKSNQDYVYAVVEWYE